MSCVLKEFGTIQELSDLISWLCPHLPVDNLDSSDPWPEWDENQMDVDKPSPPVNNGWLDECIVSVSPMLDILTIGARNRLAILTSRRNKKEPGEKRYTFTVNWKGILSNDVEGDEITSIICLPIVSQKQSSSGAPDWTSVIVGFKSGFTSFYTENGLVLLSQIFEEKPVLQLSVRTYVPKNFGACVYSDLTEELLILYPKSVVAIDGFSLLQTLKACRNQAAKAAAVGGECPAAAQMGYKKWNLSEIENVSGCVGSGIVPPHLYDHIIMMSNLNGFNQGLGGGVPTTSLLFTVGRVPYFSSFYIKEGFTQPFIADIASHYASKLKNALVSAASGWLFGNKASQDVVKKERKIEQPVSIPFRYTLPDKRREGMSIELSNSRRLATVTDDFGRVSVIDVQKNYVLRMFKGYRDAECGWITVLGDLGDREREVPFLIIHAPRRNLLEVWLPQQGPRVAAFNVDRKCRLLYSPHSLLGANSQPVNVFSTTPVVLINSQGTLERLVIPFHLAISGKTSKQARDVHLLKSIRIALRTKTIDEILTLVREMKTTSIKLQLLNMVLCSKYLTSDLSKGLLDELSGKNKSEDENKFAKGLLDELSGKNKSEDENKEMKGVNNNPSDHESKMLIQQLSRLSQLLEIFTFMKSIHDESRSESKIEDQIVHQKLCTCLRLSSENVNQLLESFDDEKLGSAREKRVSFKEIEFNFTQFLACWETNVGSVEKENSSVVSIKLKKNLLKDQEIELGNFFFGWPYNKDKLCLFAERLRLAGLNEAELLHLSFEHWCALQKIDKMVTLQFFNQLLILISFHLYCKTLDINQFCSKLKVPLPLFPKEPGPIFGHLSEVKPTWEAVRERLVGWTKPFHSYVASLICKGIESNFLIYTPKIEEELKNMEDEEQLSSLLIIDKMMEALESSSENAVSTLEPTEWEEFSMEIVEWNLLLKKLIKLTAAQRFRQTLASKDVVKFSEGSDYSVKAFMLKGKGYLSELIARWFIASKLDIESIIAIILKNDQKDEENSTAMETENVPSPTADIPMDIPDEFHDIEEEFVKLKAHFPESTRADVLLVNLSWEFAAVWKKSANDLSCYKSSVQVLQYISNAFLKHGVSSMMWETWVVYFIQVSAQLIEKVSRRPKERISMKEIGISEFNLEIFFSLSKDLLESIIAGNFGCEAKCAPPLDKDDFWQGVDTAPSLVEVTVAQKMTSCDLAFLHFQLLSVLRLIVKYDLKNVKPYALFPERDRASFFKPLISTWKSTSEEGREVVNSSQLTFLTRVVSAIVIGLPDSENCAEMPTPSDLHNVIELGRSWGVSVDAIRRHYVCELYSSGMDPMAEQALIMVRDGVMIASQMVVIAGQRLRHLITTSPQRMELTAIIALNVVQWCRNLEPGCLRYPDMPIKQTSKMVNKAVSLMSESCPEYTLATCLARSLEMVYSSSLFVNNL